MVTLVDPDDILERTQWDFFWVPNDVEIVERPQLLYCRCPRDVLILNTVTRTRADPSVVPDLVAEVVASHATVRSRWLVRDMSAAEPLRRALDGVGYTPAVATHAVAIQTTDFVPRPSSGIVVKRVLDMDTLRDRTAVLSGGFGEFREFTDAELEADLWQCTAANARVQQYVAYDESSSRAISAGGMTLFSHLGFGLLWAGCTVPDARGRGAYSAVLAARVNAAKNLGFKYVGLYAITDTSAPIVTRQGFKKVGEMTYWERPASRPQGEPKMMK